MARMTRKLGKEKNVRRKTRRRGRGEGLVHKRGDGRWEARIDLGGGPDGRRKRKSIYGPTQAAVIEQLDRLRGQLRDGMDLVAADETLGTYLPRWLAQMQVLLRPRTWESYATIVRKHVVPTLGQVKLSELTRLSVARWLTGLHAKGYADQTLRNCREVVRRALADAVGRALTSNPAANVPLPRAQRPENSEADDDGADAADAEVNALTPVEADQLLKAADEADGRYAPLFAVTLAQGLRRGEVLGLKWSDVNWEKRTLRVRRALQRVRLPESEMVGQNGSQRPRRTKLALTPVKSKKSRRTIPLADVAVAALEARRARQESERMLARDRWIETGLIFAASDGGLPDPSHVDAVFADALDRAKVRRIRLHDLRHTTASWLLSRGVQLTVVSRILGHSTVSITADIYGHISENAMTRAVAEIDAALDEVKGKHG